MNSPLVFGVDISSVVKQIFNDSHSVVTSCKVERSGVAALQVPAVYILGGAKLLPHRDNMIISISAECDNNSFTRQLKCSHL